MYTKLGHEEIYFSDAVRVGSSPQGHIAKLRCGMGITPRFRNGCFQTLYRMSLSECDFWFNIYQ